MGIGRKKQKSTTDRAVSAAQTQLRRALPH